MNQLYFSLPILLFLPFVQSTWQSFSSEKGKFTVQTPGEFVEKINKVETPIGDTEYHTFLYQSEDDKADNLVYMVSYCDYPDRFYSFRFYRIGQRIL